uniref:Uncharacterized protein n=1 Tax=Anopheles farauti TaxID=69004 RepID=A0A182QPF7_9DIPT
MAPMAIVATSPNHSPALTNASGIARMPEPSEPFSRCTNVSMSVVGCVSFRFSNGLYVPASSSSLIMSTSGRVEPAAVCTGTSFISDFMRPKMYPVSSDLLLPTIVHHRSLFPTPSGPGKDTVPRIAIIFALRTGHRSQNRHFVHETVNVLLS